ncbi:MAG: class I SAM-dependent methyltransferase [Lachnospiraceae bacterium]|nr:class I SAM-dependent methyltransferase [Lachnospiraceae bacterium]
MEKIAFYGLGEQFERNIVRNKYVCEKLKKRVISGFMDRDKSGVDIEINNEHYRVLSLDEWSDYDVDKVFITSVRYQNEIKSSLLQYGFRVEQIETLENLLFLLFDHMDRIFPCICEKGLEIGGPSAVFSYIYDRCRECDGVNFCTDTVWWKQGDSDNYICENRELGKMYIADATNLSDIPDESYEFVMSSNNLEHIANPMKAVAEFYRVLKKNGILIIVVPRKYVNFDHDRLFTPFEHLLEDYRNHVAEDDLSHLSEIIEKHDYDMDIPCGGKEQFVQRAYNNFDNRCLHHHVFDKKCLIQLFEYFNLEVLEFAETYSDYWIIGEK